MHTNLNSTGSFWMSDNGNYWSYNTKMSEYYKGEFFKNVTTYSVTTSRHQVNIPYVDFNHQLYAGRYGDWDIEDVIKDNIKALASENQRRIEKRKTKKNLEQIETNKQKIKYLQNLLNA